MKKIFSVILAALMLLCCLPAASVAAAPVTVDEDYIYDNLSGSICTLAHNAEDGLNDTEYVLSGVFEIADYQLTVAKGAKLTVNGSLTVKENSVFAVEGKAVFASGSSVIVEGSLRVNPDAELTVAGNATVEENGRMDIMSKQETTNGTTHTVNGVVLLDNGSELDVKGTLDVKGKLNSKVTDPSAKGDLVIKAYQDAVTGEWKFGKVLNSQNIGGNSSKQHYHYYAEVVFNALPSGFDWSYNMPEANGHYVSSATYYSAYDGSPYAYLNSDVSWQNIWASGLYNIGKTAQVVKLNLNQYVFFKFGLMGLDASGRTADRYDGTRIPFTFNDVSVKNTDGCNQLFVNGAGIIDCTWTKPWKAETVSYTMPENDTTHETEKYYLKNIKIYIPNGTGYEVYGKNGETSTDTETVLLKYGQEFMFKVNINEDYSKSVYDVYCVNAYQWSDDRFDASLEEKSDATDGIDPVILKDFWSSDTVTVIKFADGETGTCYKDSNGYYHISPELLTRDCSIAVNGVVKNETLSLVARILEMLRGFFRMIARFFNIG